MRWGLSFDDKGGVALCPMESDEYRRHVDGGRSRVMKAMRTKRS